MPAFLIAGQTGAGQSLAITNLSSISFRRLLVLQIADIGDLILTTPALRALRETFPQAQIDVLGTPHALPVLASTGLIDQAIVFDRFAAEGGRALLKPGNQRALWQVMRRPPA